MTKRFRLRSAGLGCLAVAAFWGGSICAHSMYQSAVLLDFVPHAVNAELQLPVDRLVISFHQTVDPSHFDSERNALSRYVLAHVRPVAPNGQAFAVQLTSLNLQTVEKAPYLVVHLHLTPPAGATTDLFTLHYDVITHQLVTHVVLVSIRSDQAAKISLPEPFLLGILRADHNSIDVDRLSVL
jgi:hypothetical protein